MRPFVFAALFLSLAAHADALLVDRVAAVIDGHAIARSLVEARALPRLKAATAKDEKARILKETLEALVEEHLIQEDAQRLRLTVSDEEVARMLVAVGQQTRLSAEALEAELEKQGLTLKEYRAALRHQLLELKWLNLKLNRSSASEADPAGDRAARARFLGALRAEFAVEVRQ